MKNYFYLLLLAITITSCTTVQSLVEQGRYDEAFEFSINKLAGKKNKKTKYVMGLEDAYARLKERDLNEINFLMAKGSPASWDRVYNIYEKLEHRQNLVRNLMPLRSRSGYTARFALDNYTSRMVEVAELSAEYHYENALQLIKASENGQKRNARRALTSLNNISKYFDDYKDSRQLKDKAINIGTEHIALQFVDYNGGVIGYNALQNLRSINISSFNTKWERFVPYEEGQVYDNYVVVELDHVFFDTEREWLEHHNFAKEIEDGYDVTYKTETTYEEKIEYVKIDPNDKASALKKVVTKVPVTKEIEVKTPRFITVYASVREIYREKQSRMVGFVKVFNNRSNTPVLEHPIEINHSFNDDAFDVSGDSRALPTQFCGIGGFIDPFPSDAEVVSDMSRSFKSAMRSVIKDYDFLNDQHI